MTDQQPHTPTTADIRNAVTRDESDWREAGAQFDRWLSAHDAEVAATAEQRGAEKAFRKTQQIIAGFEHTIDEARNRGDMINTGYLIQEIDTEIQDLTEDDDA